MPKPKRKAPKARKATKGPKAPIHPKTKRRTKRAPPVNPFDSQFKKVTSELTTLEKEAKKRQEKLEEVRRRRDQADLWRKLASTSELTISQEQRRIEQEIARAQHLIARVAADRKARKKDYASADDQVIAAERDKSASRDALNKAQEAFDQATAEVAKAKRDVADLPGEIRRLRDTVAELSERVDTGLAVKRFDVGTAERRLSKTLAELKSLAAPAELTKRVTRLEAATKQLDDATGKLEEAKEAFAVKAKKLVEVQNNTHKGSA